MPPHEDLQSYATIIESTFKCFSNYSILLYITSVQDMDEMFHLEMPESVVFVCSPPASLVWWWGGHYSVERNIQKGFTATESFDLEYLLIMSPDLMQFWYSSDPNLFYLNLILYMLGDWIGAIPSWWIISLLQVTFSLVPLWLTYIVPLLPSPSLCTTCVHMSQFSACVYVLTFPSLWHRGF